MITFGGQPVLDPALLYPQCARAGLDTSWWGQANSYRCRLGASRPGSGWLLMARSDYEALAPDSTHDLVFGVARSEILGGAPLPPGYRESVTLRGLLAVGTRSLTPGYRQDENEALLVQVADQRWLLRSAQINASYNVPAVPSGDLYPDTISGGTVAYTWAQVGQALWDAVGGLGTWPGLPFTPHGAPTNLRYFGTTAARALDHFLCRLGCAVAYDPTTAAFTVARLGVASAGWDSFLGEWDAWRADDADPIAEPWPNVPETVRVLFRVLPCPPGESHFWAEDVATPNTYLSTGRAEAGTFHTIHDDLPLYLDSAGSPTNSATVTARAAERAGDYARVLASGLDMIQRTFVLPVNDPRAAPGARVWDVEWHDLGAGIRTVFRRGLDDSMREIEFPPLRNEGVDQWSTGVGATTITYTGTTINYGGAATISVGGTTTTTYGSGTSTTFSGSLYVQGPYYQPPYSFSQWTANQTDLSLSGIGNVRLRVSSDEHYRELRSIARTAGSSGRIVCLHNVGDYVILIKHQDSGSTAINRIITSTGNDYFLAPGHEVTLYEDLAADRWRVAESSDERLEGVHEYGDLAADEDNAEIPPYLAQHRINPTSDGVAITGIKYGRPGLRHRLINANSVNGFWLRHSDSSSDAANRFLLPNGDDLRIPPRGEVETDWDGTAERWRVLHIPSSASATATLTNTYVGYGDGADELTGTADFTRVADGQVVVRTESDSVEPSLTLRRRRVGPADVETGDALGCVLFQGYLIGDQPQARIRGVYTGDGSTPGGKLVFSTVDATSTESEALTIDEDGDVEAVNANAASSLVATTAGGKLTNADLGFRLDFSANTLDVSFRGCRAYESVNSNSYGTSTWTSVPLDAENYDTDSMHDNTTNQSRLTVPTGMGGYWDIRGFYYPNTNGNAAGTVVQVRILLNGTTVLAQSIGHIDTSGAVAVSPIFDIRELAAGDYIELQVYQTGAIAMNGYGNDILCFLLASFVGIEP